MALDDTLDPVVINGLLNKLKTQFTQSKLSDQEFRTAERALTALLVQARDWPKFICFGNDATGRLLALDVRGGIWLYTVDPANGTFSWELGPALNTRRNFGQEVTS